MSSNVSTRKSHANWTWKLENATHPRFSKQSTRKIPCKSTKKHYKKPFIAAPKFTPVIHRNLTISSTEQGEESFTCGDSPCGYAIPGHRQHLHHHHHHHHRPGHQQCQQQLQGHRFRSFQRYLQQRRGGRYDDSEDRDLVPALNRPEQSGSLMQCCEELRNVNEQCRCEAITQAVREQQQEGGGYQGEEFQKVYERARNLPRMCQMRRPQQCQLSGVFV